jgi:signal transduction histidine kinase
VLEPDHDVLHRLILAEQDERRRLALFLHDGPLQELSAIALMLDGALHAIEAGASDQAQEIIRSTLRQQRDTIRELRDLSFALAPALPRPLGLAPALRALADQTQRSHGIEVDLELEGTGAIGETASIALYTILREIVEQAIRRGPPTAIVVRVARAADGGVVASVTDDAEPERRRRSIEAIEERTRQLHGTVELLVEGQRGGEIRVSLPAHTASR